MEAYFVMDNDMYRSTHPDDMSRIADAAFRFATEGGEYNVVYRSRAENNGRVTVIHAQGRHVYTETGERLAYVWYAVEGDYEEEEGESAGSLNRSFNQMLREGSMTRKIRYDTLTGLPNMTGGRHQKHKDEREKAGHSLPGLLRDEGLQQQVGLCGRG